MSRYRVMTCLALAIVLQPALASPTADRRSARSIWPFASTANTAAPSGLDVLSPENAELLERAGLGTSFNLSSHPLWKIHKYEGIDLKPVRVETEIVPMVEVKREGRAGGEGDAVGDAEVPATTEVDLSFLDDLGGLAPFLPEPDSNDEASDLIANAIKKEEEQQPGFLAKVWEKIWGQPSRYVMSMFSSGEAQVEAEAIAEAVAEEKKSEAEADDSVAIYLPETQGSYVAVVVPPTGKSGEVAEPLLPVHYPSQFQAATTPRAVAPFPAPRNFSRSQAWVQSWTPDASYSYEIKNEPVGNDLEPSSSNDTPYQRKISPDDGAVVTENSPEQQPTTEANSPPAAEEVTEKSGKAEVDPAKDVVEQAPKAVAETEVREKPAVSQAASADPAKDKVEQARNILSSFHLPEGLLKKLQVRQQDVDEILNDEESAARASARLRALQREFEMRKEQLSYGYSRVRKQS